jgi:hypothetical protein
MRDLRRAWLLYIRMDFVERSHLRWMPGGAHDDLTYVVCRGYRARLPARIFPVLPDPLRENSSSMTAYRKPAAASPPVGNETNMRP